MLVYWSRPGAGLPVAGDAKATRRRAATGATGASTRSSQATHALQVAHALDERAEIAAQTALRTLLPLVAADPAARRADLVRASAAACARSMRCRARSASAGPTRWRRWRSAACREELQPLAASLNALLARLDEALARAAPLHRRRRARAAHAARGAQAAGRARARAGDAPARAAAYDDLEGGVARASHLVDQLLTMARLEPEALATFRAECDLVALAKDAIVARAPLAEAQRIDLGLARDGGRPGARRSASLAIAACQPARQRAALHARGRTHRRCGRPTMADAAMLSVIDTGPGIPPPSASACSSASTAAADAEARHGQRPRAVDRQAHRRRAWRDAVDAGRQGLAVRVRFQRPCRPRALSAPASCA